MPKPSPPRVMSADARQFLNYEFATLALVAGLATRNPRAPVYRKGTSDSDKQRMKAWLRGELKSMVNPYRGGPVGDTKHIENIAALANAATREFGEILLDRKLRFGVAQKLVNLYLKYLWVTNDIDEPPHCPIDGRIASKAELTYRWTESDSQAEYRAAVAALRTGQGGTSIAVWELRAFEVDRE